MSFELAVVFQYNPDGALLTFENHVRAAWCNATAGRGSPDYIVDSESAAHAQVAVQDCCMRMTWDGCCSKSAFGLSALIHAQKERKELKHAFHFKASFYQRCCQTKII